MSTPTSPISRPRPTNLALTHSNLTSSESPVLFPSFTTPTPSTAPGTAWIMTSSSTPVHFGVVTAYAVQSVTTGAGLQSAKVVFEEDDADDADDEEEVWERRYTVGYRGLLAEYITPVASPSNEPCLRGGYSSSSSISSLSSSSSSSSFIASPVLSNSPTFFESISLTPNQFSDPSLPSPHAWPTENIVRGDTQRSYVATSSEYSSGDDSTSSDESEGPVNVSYWSSDSESDSGSDSDSDSASGSSGSPSPVPRRPFRPAPSFTTPHFGPSSPTTGSFTSPPLSPRTVPLLPRPTTFSKTHPLMKRPSPIYAPHRNQSQKDAAFQVALFLTSPVTPSPGDSEVSFSPGGSRKMTRGEFKKTVKVLARRVAAFEARARALREEMNTFKSSSRPAPTTPGAPENPSAQLRRRHAERRRKQLVKSAEESFTREVNDATSAEIKFVAETRLRNLSLLQPGLLLETDVDRAKVLGPEEVYEMPQGPVPRITETKLGLVRHSISIAPRADIKKRML